ncbi:MAG TPA: BrnT family toxin [Terriglobia bacterium]|nr:BrnT family toxin [Terriglobia bacterium]
MWYTTRRKYEPPCLEPRFAALGETSERKLLFLAFTLRSENIRVISARPMNERERKFYASLRQE